MNRIYLILIVFTVALICVFLMLRNIPGTDVRRAVRSSKPVVVGMQPFAGMPEKQYRTVFEGLKKLNCNIVLFPVIQLPSQAYYKPGGRYRADSIIQWIGRRTGRADVVIGLTSSDISTSKGNIADWGVMGFGSMPGNSCVVSAYRLDKENLDEQLLKVCIHELGHTQGLPHCAQKDCYMRDAEGHNVWDQLHGFCKTCQDKLIRLGWNVTHL